MGEHGEVHGAPCGEAQASHGVERLVAPDPELGPGPRLSPATPGDQVQAGDGDQVWDHQLRQPELLRRAVVDVQPARHVQVGSSQREVRF